MAAFIKNMSLRAKLLAGGATALAIAAGAQEVWTYGRPTVSIIPLNGTIMTGRSGGLAPTLINMDNTRKMIDNAFKQKNLQVVLLSINSPGGSPVQSDLISSYIKGKAEKANVKVKVFVEDRAASGGYWLACTGDEIFATRASVVGSIGVISASLGFHQIIDKYGIERRIFTAGENKSKLDPLSPLKEEDVKFIRALLEDMHKTFIDHVKTGRGDRLKGDDKTLFNGDFWTAGPALELGLIDGIDTLDGYIARNYDEKKVKVYRAKRGGALSDVFGAQLEILSSIASSLALIANNPVGSLATTSHSEGSIGQLPIAAITENVDHKLSAAALSSTTDRITTEAAYNETIDATLNETVKNKTTEVH